MTAEARRAYARPITPKLGTSKAAASRKVRNSTHIIRACDLLNPRSRNKPLKGATATFKAPTIANIARNGATPAHFSPSNTWVKGSATATNPHAAASVRVCGTPVFSGPPLSLVARIVFNAGERWKECPHDRWAQFGGWQLTNLGCHAIDPKGVGVANAAHYQFICLAGAKLPCRI